jgi:hypothetical protein
MAIFPELIPSTRTYSPGAFPHTAHGVYDGSEARVRHSSTVLGVRLRLFFPALTTSELLAVIAHYAGQQGRFLPFAIPDDLLSGTDTPADFTPAGHQWRYAARPTVEDISIVGGTNVHNLTVELETVPPENTIVPGARLRVRTSFRPGSAQLGEFFDVTVAFAPGAASAAAPGLEVTATATFAPGAATGDTFTPLDLSPLAWWDASDAATVTTSSGDISDWDDKSGNGWHLEQTTSGNRPAYTTSAINGLNAAQWPSTDNAEFLKTAASYFEWREMYAVVDFDGASFSNYEGLFNGGSSSNADGWTTGNAGVSSWYFGMKTYINGNNGTDRQTNLFSELSSPCLLRCDPDTPRGSNDGVVIGTDRTFSSYGRGWNGYICEVIVFDAVLSSGDRADLETYLMDKWGV